MTLEFLNYLLLGLILISIISLIIYYRLIINLLLLFELIILLLNTYLIIISTYYDSIEGIVFSFIILGVSAIELSIGITIFILYWNLKMNFIKNLTLKKYYV